MIDSPFRFNGAFVEAMWTLDKPKKEKQPDYGLDASPCTVNKHNQRVLYIFHLILLDNFHFFNFSAFCSFSSLRLGFLCPSSSNPSVEHIIVSIKQLFLPNPDNTVNA